MKKFNLIDTIISPRITEKTTSLSEQNKIVFKVHGGATKKSIKRSVEKIFKVNVIKVNTVNQKGKTKFKIKELRAKYLFTLIYCFLEKNLLRKHLKNEKKI